MGEYSRDNEYQIYSALGSRINALARQYPEMRSKLNIPQNENYGATLTVCLLQTLLTSVNELRKRKQIVPELMTQRMTDIPDTFGIRLSMVKEDTFYETPLRFGAVLERIRNAMSHPTNVDLESEYSATGYTTIEGNSGQVEKFCFVNSKDIHAQTMTPITYHQVDDRVRFIKHLATMKRLAPNLQLKEMQDHTGRLFCSYQNGRPFLRKFRIEVPLVSLKELVLGLSEYLSQDLLLVSVDATDRRRANAR